MKKLSYILSIVLVSILIFGSTLMAQDEGTYVDDASPMDSSYVEGDALDFGEYAEEESESGSMLYIAGAAIIVVAGIVIVVLRKKKNK